MQLLVEEFEPIVTATEIAQERPSLVPRESVRKEEDPHVVRRLDRVAKLCVAQIRSIDRSVVRIGRYVSRLVRHYDRERGLTALSARITKMYGKIVSRQHLGQALCVFESYNPDEFENRFSVLTNTHLLRAAQGFPDLCDRDARNALLDRAVKENFSVADLTTHIKIHKAASTSADIQASAPLAVAQVTREIQVAFEISCTCDSWPLEDDQVCLSVNPLTTAAILECVERDTHRSHLTYRDGFLIVQSGSQPYQMTTRVERISLRSLDGRSTAGAFQC